MQGMVPQNVSQIQNSNILCRMYCYDNERSKELVIKVCGTESLSENLSQLICGTESSSDYDIISAQEGGYYYMRTAS